VEYIIASLIAILAATLIVYKLANNIFGLGLRLRPLLLCAVCSMFISLVLPKIVVGFAGLPGTLAVLAIFAVVFAYFVAKCEDEPSPRGSEVETAATCSLAVASDGIVQTVTNESHPESDTLFASKLVDEAAASDVLQQEDSFLSSNASGQLLPESEAVLPETGDVILPTVTVNEADLEEQTVTGPFVDHVDNQVSTEAALSDETWEDEITEPVAVLEQSVVQEDGLVQAVAGDAETFDDVQEEEVAELAAVLEQPVAQEQGSVPAVIEDTENLDEVGEEEVTEFTPAWEQPLAPEEELPAELPGAIDQAEELAELSGIAATEVWQPMSDEITGQDEPEQESFLEMPESSFVQEADNLIMDYNHSAGAAIQFESEELDDLLDFAFISKESQDYTAAFNAFNRALTLYPASEAAPFLTVEIGNILKNRGAYDDAIKVFLDGRNLSQTRQDKMMEQEFISTIAYLRITKNVLVQNRLGDIPFCEIPPHILDQIDEEFREWRNVGNI
jgi:tetratricopeptide (TPR) repeat protein